MHALFPGSRLAIWSRDRHDADDDSPRLAD
jgi:hypothetical protein